MFIQNQGNFMIYNAVEKKSEILVERSNERFITASSHDFSADKKFILTTNHIVKLFRHSFYALWSVYDVENKQMINVTVGGVQVALRLVKFSPVDNSMILIHNNNIYYKKSPTDPEIQITNDGSDPRDRLNYISNGVPE